VISDELWNTWPLLKSVNYRREILKETMNFHLVTEPVAEYLDQHKKNLILGYFPNLSSQNGQHLSDLYIDKNRSTPEEKRLTKFKVDRLKDRILPVLADSMRRLHGVDFCNEYWEILLGPWLTVATNNTFLRLNSFQKSRKFGTITSMSLINSLKPLPAAQDTTEFFELILNVEWKNARDWRIATYLNLDVSPKEVETVLPSEDLLPNRRNRESMFRLGKSYLQKMTTQFNRFNSGYLLATYMPPKTEFKVSLLLGQIPVANRQVSWRQNVLSIEEGNYMRREFLEDIQTVDFEGDDKFILLELSEQIPTVFLEHYEEVRKMCHEVFPKNPSFAFTSNSFHQDELFKFWIAERKLTGMKYLVGQHGNNYGANNLTSPTTEEKTCDQFLTWGWSKSNGRYVPSIVLKTAGLTRRANGSKGLLFLTTSVPNGHSPWDETVEYFNQLELQHEFVNNLNDSVKSVMTVRIPPFNLRVGDYMPNSWTKEPINHSLDLGNKPYLSERGKYRLAVLSYDSTGLLEGLASNVPTMAFWLDGLDHLNDFARAKYQILVDAGIVFLDSTDCATMVNEVWDDVDGWWNSSEIQEARKKFCADFCEYSSTPARDIAKAIKRAISS
jgi:putative transferase (TIGR04331 family)